MYLLPPSPRLDEDSKLDSDALDQYQATAQPEEDKGAEEAKRQKGRELDDALYAALLSRAHSDQACALVDAVTKTIAEHEIAGSLRANKRDKKHKTLRLAVEAFLADLLQAQASQKAKGFVYRPVRPDGFTGQSVSYRTFRSLTNAMVNLGLLECHKGFQVWRDRDDTLGPSAPFMQKATRFRATQRLLDVFALHGVHAVDFHQHFLIPLPENPLQLRAELRRNHYGDKIKGKLLRFQHNAKTKELEQQLKRLNEFFDRFELRGGLHRGYLRGFNNGDHPKFNWDMGGRLYCYGGEFNYQQMERADRLRMTINGEPVCEIDIRASYLTIFHALYGERFDAARDPYDVPGLGPGAREIVKMWITASFGNNAPINKWPRDLVAKYHEKTGAKLGKRYSASKISQKVLQAFPLLARLGEIVKGRERGWAELMYIESQAVLSTMMGLMHKRIPSLAVHDSIIVPRSNWQEAAIDLAHWYHRFTNVWPGLVPHPPKGHNELPVVIRGEVVGDHGSDFPNHVPGSSDPQSAPEDGDDPGAGKTPTTSSQCELDGNHQQRSTSNTKEPRSLKAP